MQTSIPVKTWIRLAVVWAVVLIFYLLSDAIHQAGQTLPGSAGIFILLLSTIIGAAFGVVKEADALAEKLGEPYGTLILTLSVVSIEVILIAAVMLGPGEHPSIGKDSIFSVMLIIMNLVMGLCVLTGGLKYGEQAYNAQGTSSYLGMIVLLGSIGMLLPNYIHGKGDGQFSDVQAVSLSLLVIILYGFFLYFQMGKYRYLYMQPENGNMETRYSRVSQLATVPKTHARLARSVSTLGGSLMLLGMLLPIVLLSDELAVVVDYGISAAGLPVQLGGVLIAVIVFTPESITAIRAALNNEFQRAINLCQGAFVSTVGLSIPSVLLVGLIAGKTVRFGLNSTETLLFVLTMLLSVITFSGKRTTPFAGILHLALFAIFILSIFSP